MNNPQIQADLHAFVLQHFPAARSQQLAENASLLEQGIVDSLGVLEIVTFIEERFGVILSDDELVSESFESIPAMADMVARKLAENQTCSS